MPNTPSLTWPFNVNNAESSSVDAFWGIDRVLEMQVRLLNHAVDANRNLWAAWAPWLQMTPWLLNTAIAPIEAEIEGEEPAVTVDGIPDTLEVQARSWNRYLDAYRSFWTPWGWSTPWTQALGESGAEPAGLHGRGEAANSPNDEPATPRRSAPKRASAARRKGS